MRFIFVFLSVIYAPGLIADHTPAGGWYVFDKIASDESVLAKIPELRKKGYTKITLKVLP